jgi:1,4-dihydroxy-2-naphthoate octaprenyltransferase
MTKITGDKIKWWFVAGRYFVIPLLLVFSFYAVSLAGGSWREYLLSLLICGSVWIGSHYINNYQDWKSGEDRISGGSAPKSYTSACMILPRGLLSPRTMVITGISFILASFIAFLLFAPLYLFPVWLLGSFCAVSYSPIFKKRKIGEVCWGLAFFAFAVFSYGLACPIDLTGLAAGFLLGMLIFSFYVIDQLPDITGPTEKVMGLAEKVLAANMKPSSFFWFAVTAVFVIQMAFVMMGFFSPTTLVSIFSLPVAHIVGISCDLEIGKGAKLALLWLLIFPLLVGCGALVTL